MSAFATGPTIGVRTAHDLDAVGAPADSATRTLYGLLSAQARLDPSADAIVALGRAPLSYGALLEQIDGIRLILNGFGLGRGDRIAILGARGPEMAVALLGVACCATGVPLNPAAPVSELELAFKDTAAKAVLVPPTASDDARDLARRLGLTLLEYCADESASACGLLISGGRLGKAAQGGPALSDDIAFVVRTSGTTSRAKIVPIRHRNIVARTEKSRRLLSLSATDRCLNLMPLCYHHGINSGLTLPLVAGCAVIVPPAFTAEAFLACMRDFSPTWYTGSFTYHQAILEWLERRPDALAGHRLRFMRAGSGPLPPRVRFRIEEILGVPLLEIYGSTETGTIAASSLAGPRRPGTVGGSPDDDIAIMDENGRLLAPGNPGEVVVRGATVFEGYESDLAANERVFRGDWYRTGDLAVVETDGCMRILGRLDEVINRGGEKIAPREIDEALLMHEAVAEAVSFPVPHTTLHQEVAAAVVLRDGMKVTGDELRRYLATRLAPFKVPRVILCTSELPKGPTGKLNRKNLAEHFGLQAGTAPSTRAGIEGDAETETQKVLLKFWREVLNRQDVGCDSDFFLSGGDSLSAVDLLHRIEAELRIHLPLDILVEAPTIRLLEKRLETAPSVPASHTIRIHAGGLQRPLFVVGGTGGSCLYLYPALHALGTDQPCYGLQPPGMGWDSIGCTTLPEMAAHYVEVVKAIQPRGPYRLFGHSFGGRMVYEMALQLQRMGEPVEFLGLLDSFPSASTEADDTDASTMPAKNLPQPQNEAEAANVGIIESHWRAGRSHTLDRRSAQDAFKGELTYFYCTGEPVLARHDRRRLWQRFAHGGFRLLPLPGLHIWSGQGAQYTALPKLLRACLNGEPLTVSDPATVFDRTYRLDKRGSGESVFSSTGDEYRIDPSLIQGYVDTFTIDGEIVRLGGWAVEQGRRDPAQTIAVFLGDRYLGYGASGTSRPDIAQELDEPSAQYIGFDFTFWRGAIAGSLERPRLFVLSDNGCAAELRFNAVQEAAELRARLAESEKTTAELAERLDAMEQSTSWRVTHPLRQIGLLLKRIAGR